jgi:hypothetical protein
MAILALVFKESMDRKLLAITRTATRGSWRIDTLDEVAYYREGGILLRFCGKWRDCSEMPRDPFVGGVPWL